MQLTTLTPLGQLSTFLAHGACVVNTGSPMVFTGIQYYYGVDILRASIRQRLLILYYQRF